MAGLLNNPYAESMAALAQEGNYGTPQTPWYVKPFVDPMWLAKSLRSAKRGIGDFLSSKEPGTASDFAKTGLAGIPGIVGDVGEMATAIDEYSGGRVPGMGILSHYDRYPSTREIATGMGANPDTLAGIGGELASPFPNEALAAAKVGSGLLSTMSLPPVRRAVTNAFQPLVKWTPDGGVHLNAPAYHGSPHKFEVPSNEYMGSGEGAQAYGWGHYVGESEGTGKWYQDNLSHWGKPEGMDKADYESLPDYIKGLLHTRANVGDWMPWSTIEKEAASAGDEYAGIIADLRRHSDEITLEPGGHLYEYDIPDEAIDKMLDWDKPLSEQPAILDKLKQSDLTAFGGNSSGWRDAPDGMWENATKQWTGEYLYRQLAEGGDDAAVSAKLNELGIPGIKYLDGTSRSAGEGTRNMVLFDPENTVRSVKRDGDEVFRKK